MSDDLDLARFKFIGKVLAICTHEIRNHLAIIRESAGLISDLTELASPKGVMANIKKPLDTIDSQGLRSASFLATLSAFCHRLDHKVSVFNINEVIVELITLINRMLNQREIRIERSLQDALPDIEGSPYLLQFVVFCFIEKVQNGDTIIINTNKGLSDLRVRLTCQKCARESDDLIGSDMLINSACEQGGIVLDNRGSEMLLLVPIKKGGSI